ncbi:hypothetical protein M5V91_13605 [Cytobacillus pseudoceanisediminis]|uniref:hypothetical protein n=1 Tax=Cytobacillus pseudoceanisediminis TaxID=3051614 RepID=UPI002189AA9D|nr:hypothetical protein [Cytobacillus pseudoceanisediminis]UQX56505.1 hypothetical protein M5V91_13605 [Cytobacillus pseudoceanisediminis]
MKQEELTSLAIKNLHTVKDLEAVYELETRIWSAEEAVPVNHTVATVKNGGFVLGAFLEEELIGFQYSFPGFDGTKVYLCSHSLGVHEEYRAFGIGEKLKHAQKRQRLRKAMILFRGHMTRLKRLMPISICINSVRYALNILKMLMVKCQTI